MLRHSVYGAQLHLNFKTKSLPISARSLICSITIGWELEGLSVGNVFRWQGLESKHKQAICSLSNKTFCITNNFGNSSTSLYVPIGLRACSQLTRKATTTQASFPAVFLFSRVTTHHLNPFPIHGYLSPFSGKCLESMFIKNRAKTWTFPSSQFSALLHHSVGKHCHLHFISLIYGARKNAFDAYFSVLYLSVYTIDKFPRVACLDERRTLKGKHQNFLSFWVLRSRVYLKWVNKNSKLLVQRFFNENWNQSLLQSHVAVQHAY